MFPEAALLAWSALAVVWWGISLWLVWTHRADEAVMSAGRPEKKLTIFKPLPPLGTGPFDLRGIESFLDQLGEHDEVLLGGHEADRARLEPAIVALQARDAGARLRTVWRSEADSVANPKIAWLKILAPQASGELWLWSDADVVAPRGFLRSARDEYARAGARLVTWPYAVREIPAAPALLDALYVNAEFLPGVLLLRRLGPVDFGLGAGMLFARADLEAAVSWEELGAALADDFVLGRRLQPVRIGRAMLSTAAEARTWRDAIAHYLRWSKTVRWNRPGGTAGRIVVLPVLGWIASSLVDPGSGFGWLGLLAMMQIDVAAAAFLCRRAGCRLRPHDLPALEMWSLGRALAWMICWLPGRVAWRGQTWGGPVAKRPKSAS